MLQLLCVTDFVNKGFKNRNRVYIFDKHVGGHMSAHNKPLGNLNEFKTARVTCQDIVKATIYVFPSFLLMTASMSHRLQLPPLTLQQPQ